jgi:hypothetical protein
MQLSQMPFSRPKKPKPALNLVLLKENHKDQAVELLSELVSQTEITFKGLGYTKEETKIYAEAEISQSIKHNLCFGVFIEDRLASLLTCQDLSDYLDADEIGCEASDSFAEKHSRWSEATKHCYTEDIKQLYSKEGRKPYEILVIGMVVVHPDFRNIGLMNLMMDFLVNHHPFTRTAKMILGLTTVVGSYRAMKKAGARFILEVPYKDLMWRGTHVFSNLSGVQHMYPDVLEDKVTWFVIPMPSVSAAPRPTL